MSRSLAVLSLLLESVAATMCAAGDFYGVLGVTSDASRKDISVAFRRLSLQWHPDKNMQRREEAERRMREISEAYTVLSDAEERRNYDASRPAFQALQSEPTFWYQSFSQPQQASGGYWQQMFEPTKQASAGSWYQSASQAQQASGGYWEQSSSQTKQASGGYWEHSFSQTKQASGGYWEHSSQTKQASGGYWEQSFSQTQHGYKQTWSWRQPQEQPQCASSEYYYVRFA